MAPFFWPVRVYYEDTDAGGVVYYANYLKFMERARTEWLREKGVSQMHVRSCSSVIFVVREAKVGYLAPARLDDALRVSVAVHEIGRASLTLRQEVCRESVVLAEGEIKVVCVSAENFKPQAIPGEIRARIV